MLKSLWSSFRDSTPMTKGLIGAIILMTGVATIDAANRTSVVETSVADMRGTN